MLKHNKKRSLFGQYLQQSWPSLWVIERMLFKYKPDRLVELGAGNGLLSAYLWMYARINNAEFFTIDIDAEKSKANELCKVNQMDIYDENTIEIVSDFLKTGNRPFLLVDGLDPKSNEVNLYAPRIKKGTVIFAHDCALTGSETEEKPRWCFTEDQINWDQVERLEPYYSWSVGLDTRMLCLRKIRPAL